MTLKFLISIGLCIALTSCKDKIQTPEASIEAKEKSEKIINESDIAKLKYIDFILDEKSEKIIEDWHHYEELSNIASNVKKADLTDFEENHKVIVALIKDLKRNIPVSLKKESILARLLVIETKLLKLESVTNLASVKKEELASGIKEFLVSFSNLNFQINKKQERDSQKITRPN